MTDDWHRRRRPSTALGTTLFARYGVRECWIMHVKAQRIEVPSFAEGTIVARRAFERGEMIVSEVLPGFRESPLSMLGY